MKHFIQRVLLFSGVLILLLVIGFLLPATPRVSKSLLFAKIGKDSLLKNINSPRIIFVGGSNLSFGINSQAIKDSLKLNPINTAVHASIGLVYMMDNTLRFIKKDDIVILVPEYSQFYGRFAFGGEQLLRTVADIDPMKILDLRYEQLINIVSFIPKYSFSKFKPTDYVGFKEDKVYSVNSFNQYGDVDTHWTMQQQNYKPAGTIPGSFNSSVIKLIIDFKMELENKGSKLWITYPGYQTYSFNVNKDKIKKVEEELVRNDLEILGTPERYRMPDSMMFNSSYHLLKKGIDYRTELLIEDLRKR